MHEINISEATKNAFQDMLVWDSHAGIFPSPDVDLSKLSEWHEAGVNYVSINVGFDVMDWEATLNTLTAYRNWLETKQDSIVLASTVKDILLAKESNKLAVSFDIEGMNALNDNINMVRAYHKLGVRQMLFAYNLSNSASGGCHDTDSGLTDFGQAIVSEMNDVGIIVDCSHTAYTTTLDIMNMSTKPVVFSHSNPNAVYPHQRNITDEQALACAKTGGVVGVNGMGIFINTNSDKTEDLLKHICHLSDLIGPEHVGFGLDYSPAMDLDVHEILAKRPDYWPPNNGYDTKGIKHYSPFQLIDLMAQMQAKGFSQLEIQGIMGANFMRVASETWSS